MSNFDLLENTDENESLESQFAFGLNSAEQYSPEEHCNALAVARQKDMTPSEALEQKLKPESWLRMQTMTPEQLKFFVRNQAATALLYNNPKSLKLADAVEKAKDRPKADAEERRRKQRDEAIKGYKLVWGAQADTPDSLQDWSNSYVSAQRDKFVKHRLDEFEKENPNPGPETTIAHDFTGKPTMVIPDTPRMKEWREKRRQAEQNAIQEFNQSWIKSFVLRGLDKVSPTTMANIEKAKKLIQDPEGDSWFFKENIRKAMNLPYIKGNPYAEYMVSQYAMDLYGRQSRLMLLMDQYLPGWQDEDENIQDMLFHKMANDDGIDISDMTPQMFHQMKTFQGRWGEFLNVFDVPELITDAFKGRLDFDNAFADGVYKKYDFDNVTPDMDASKLIELGSRMRKQLNQQRGANWGSMMLSNLSKSFRYSLEYAALAGMTGGVGVIDDILKPLMQAKVPLRSKEGMTLIAKALAQVGIEGLKKTMSTPNIAMQTVAADRDYEDGLFLQNDKGELVSVKPNIVDDWATRFARNMLGSFSEYTTEEMGAFIPGLKTFKLKGMTDAQKAAYLQEMLKETGWKVMTRNSLKKFGFNGLPGEISEELDQQLFSAASTKIGRAFDIPWMDMGDDRFIQTPQEYANLLVLVGVQSALLGGSHAVVNRALYGKEAVNNAIRSMEIREALEDTGLVETDEQTARDVLEKEGALSGVVLLSAEKVKEMYKGNEEVFNRLGVTQETLDKGEKTIAVSLRDLTIEGAKGDTGGAFYDEVMKNSLDKDSLRALYSDEIRDFNEKFKTRKEIVDRMQEQVEKAITLHPEKIHVAEAAAMFSTILGQLQQRMDGEALNQAADQLVTAYLQDPEKFTADYDMHLSAETQKGIVGHLSNALGNNFHIWTDKELEEIKKERVQELLDNGTFKTREEAEAYLQGKEIQGKQVGDVIYINPHTKLNLNYIYGHELNHYLKKFQPELYARLGDLLTEAIQGKDGQRDAAAQRVWEEMEKNYPDLKDRIDDLNEEFQGDLLGYVFQEPQFLTTLANALEKRQQGLGAQLLESIQQILMHIMDYARRVLHLDPNAGQLFNNARDLYMDIADLLADYAARQNGETSDISAENGKYMVSEGEETETEKDNKKTSKDDKKVRHSFSHVILSSFDDLLNVSSLDENARKFVSSLKNIVLSFEKGEPVPVPQDASYSESQIKHVILKEPLSAHNFVTSLDTVGFNRRLEGISSVYKTVDDVTIRVSNHPANARNFIQDETQNNLSIVLERKQRKQRKQKKPIVFKADANFPVIEVVYKRDYLEHHPEVLPIILLDMASFVVTKEYHSTVPAFDYHFSGDEDQIAMARKNLAIDALTNTELEKQLDKIYLLAVQKKDKAKAKAMIQARKDAVGYDNDDSKNKPKNQRLIDGVIYDDKGNVIPLSQLFNKSKDDEEGAIGEKSSDGRFLITPQEDATYMDAVKRGDMETAQRMVDEAERRSGYSHDDSWRMDHRAPNKADGDVSLDNVKENGIVPEDYWEHPEWYQTGDFEMQAFWKVRQALELSEKRKAEGNERPVGIWVYRAVSKTRNKKESDFRNGDWVTPIREYAEQEGRENPEGYRIISRYALLRNLYWDGNSIAELGYDDGENYTYADTRNNRKLLDPVTYDDEGNVIPLSQRFNKRNDDVRWMVSEREKQLLTRSKNKLKKIYKLAINTKKNTNVFKNRKSLYLSPVPHILQWLGIPDGSIKTKVFILRKLFNDHEIDSETFSKIPLGYANPVIVFKDENGIDYDVITDLEAKDLEKRNGPIMVYFRFSEKGFYFASAYSRTEAGEEKYIRAIKEKRILYYDKERALNLPFKDKAKSLIKTLNVEGSQIKTPEDFEKYLESINKNNLSLQSDFSSQGDTENAPDFSSRGGKNLITRDNVDDAFGTIGREAQATQAVYANHNDILDTLKSTDADNAWKQLAPSLLAFAGDLKGLDLSTPDIDAAIETLGGIDNLPEAFDRFMRDGTARDDATRDALSTLKGLLLSVWSGNGGNLQIDGDVATALDTALAAGECVDNTVPFGEIRKALQSLEGTGIPGNGLPYDTLHLLHRAETQAKEKQERYLSRLLEQFRKVWRGEAKQMMEQDRDYQAWEKIKAGNGLDYNMVKTLLGAEKTKALRERGLLSKKADSVNAAEIDYNNLEESKTVNPYELALSLGYVDVYQMTDALLAMQTPAAFTKDYVNRMAQSWLSEQGWKLDEEALGNSEIIDGMKRLEKMLADRLNWPLFSQSFKNDAYNLVHAMKVGEILSDNKALTDARLLINDIVKASGKKEADAASVMKSVGQLRLQLEILRQKAMLKKDVGKIQRKMLKDAHAQKGTIHSFYHDALKELAYVFGVSKAAPETMDGRQRAKSALETKGEDDTMEPRVWGDWLLSSENRRFSDLSVAEFEELADFVRAVSGVGRSLVTEDRQSIAARNAETLQGFLADNADKPHKYTKHADAGLVERVRHYVNLFNAIWVKLWRFMGEAGPTMRRMYDTLSEAAYKEMELRQKTVMALNKAMDEIAPHLGEVNLDNLPALPENSQGYQKWSPEMVIMAVLHMGTETGRQRLRDGFGWTDAQLNQIASALPSPILSQLNNVWQIMGRGEMTQADKEEFLKENYYELKTLPPVEFQVLGSDGVTVDMTGGYVPISYLYSNRGHDVTIGYNAMSVYATPSSIHERAQEIRDVAPLVLSWGTLLSNISDRCHYSTHRLALRDIFAVVTDKDFRRTYGETQSFERYAAMMQILRHIANPTQDEHKALNFLERFGKSMLVPCSLAFNLASVGMQLTSLTVGSLEQGGHFGRAVLSMCAHPFETMAAAREKSPMMRERAEMIDIDMHKATTIFNKSKLKKVQETFNLLGYYMMKTVDSFVATIDFTAAYEKAIAEGRDEAEAIAYAEDFVARTQGATRAMDVSTVSLSPLGRMITPFFTAVCAQQNVVAHDLFDADKNAMQKAMATTLNLLLPALMAGSLRFLLAGGAGDDEDKKERARIAMVREIMQQPVAGIPVLRDVVDYAAGQMMGRKGGSVIEAGWVEAINETANLIGEGVKAADEGAWQYTCYIAADAVSRMLRVPLVVVYSRQQRLLENLGINVPNLKKELKGK